MESIEKLRGYTLCEERGTFTVYEPSDRLADEIEAEVAERYIELPVDVNNEPVHIGDEMEHRSKSETLDVIAVGNDCFFTGRLADRYVRCVDVSAEWHHVKPDPLKELLCDMIHEYGGTDELTETVAGRYADRIRELMEVG